MQQNFCVSKLLYHHCIFLDKMAFIKVPLHCKRTAFADETQWRFQFLDTLFRFRDI